MPQPDIGDSNSIIVRHRAYDSSGPDGSAKYAPEYWKAVKAHGRRAALLARRLSIAGKDNDAISFVEQRELIGL